jgi:glyoxylase-like metal-dependent hydrolase (beta-lactamase superfamily II)
MRLIPLLAGEIRLSSSFTACPPGPLGPWRGMLRQVLRRDLHWAPVPVFLIEHPREGPVLVDTGYSASVADHPARTLGRATATLFEHRPYDLDALLARHGVRASDVRTVVMTHLHSDHASGLDRFPGATVVADRREWEIGDRGGFGLAAGGYVPEVVRAVRRRQVVAFDEPGVRPLGPFDRTIDLFSDGSVVLLSTPGHSPGHTSVLVRTGAGEVLLTGDAADLRSMVDRPAPTAVMSSRRDFFSSLERIRRWRALHPGATVIPGHDHETWPALAQAYG